MLTVEPLFEPSFCLFDSPQSARRKGALVAAHSFWTGPGGPTPSDSAQRLQPHRDHFEEGQHTECGGGGDQLIAQTTGFGDDRPPK